MPVENASFRAARTIITFSALFLPVLLISLNAFLREVSLESHESPLDTDKVGRGRRAISGVLVIVTVFVLADLLALSELLLTPGMSIPVQIALVLVGISLIGLIWIFWKLRQEYVITIEVY